MAKGKLSRLETLDLSSNEINDDEAVILCKHLDKLPQLTTLRLSNNEIGDRGIRALVQAIQPLSNIKSLDVEQNHFGEIGQQALLAIFDDERLIEPTDTWTDEEPGSALAEDLSALPNEPSAPEQEPGNQEEPVIGKVLEQIEGMPVNTSEPQTTDDNPDDNPVEGIPGPTTTEAENEGRSDLNPGSVSAEGLSASPTEPSAPELEPEEQK